MSAAEGVERPSDAAGLMATEKSGIFEARLRDAEACRVHGNDLYKQVRYDEAEAAYRRALYHVEMDELQIQFELQDEHREQLYAQMVPALLNLSQCLLKLDRAAEAVEHTSSVIKIDPKHTKALYLRSKAHRAEEEFDKQLEDLTLACSLDAQDKELRVALKIAQAEKRKDDAERGQMWRGKLAEPVRQEVKASEAGSDSSRSAQAAMTAFEQMQGFLVVAFVLALASGVAMLLLKYGSSLDLRSRDSEL